MCIPGRRGLFIDTDSDSDFDFDPILVLLLASPPPNTPSAISAGDLPIRTEGPHRYRYRYRPRLELFGFCGSGSLFYSTLNWVGIYSYSQTGGLSL